MQNVQLLQELVEASRSKGRDGKVADYIPELAHASPDILGITVHDLHGERITAGDCNKLFTLQSISKVFALILALIDHGQEKVFEKVGMEPTGDNFNSMVKLELVQPGKPFNPMINAGAIAVTSLIKGQTPELRFARILEFIRTVAGDDKLEYNEQIYHSEKNSADRNRSIGYLLKHNEVLEGDVHEHLDVYFKQCSIEATCQHVARMALVLANHGIDPDSGEQIIPNTYVQIAKVFMTTCGMYNASGEFAIKVGIPAKSGVSGGIMALVPDRIGIGVIGPALNDMGNSIAGVHLLEQLSKEWNLSIF